MKYLVTLLLLPLISVAESFERETPRIHAYNFVTSRQFDGPLIWKYGGDQEGNLYFRGFSLINYGPNDIIWDPPVDFLNTPSREYYFMSDDNSRRDTYLWVTDYNGSGRTSDFFESVFVFLPRLTPPQVSENGEYLNVTLPTGEEIRFIEKYVTLDSPLLIEEPLDLNPDRNLRQHISLKYSGEGIIIRSDSKGSDPRLAKTVEVIKGDLKPCKLPGSLFWTQENFPKFKFIHDQEVFDLIEKECGIEFLP